MTIPKYTWPKGPATWVRDRTLYASIPFTWNLPEIKKSLKQRQLFSDSVVVGGPATKLMPHYFDDLPYVTVADDYPNVLQMINPLATKTTLGCTRRCEFCGIGQQWIEAGPFKELDDWEDLPIICDNNLTAASKEHFQHVIDRLVWHGWCDFNQGLDCRMITPWHAQQIRRIKKPIVRLALDGWGDVYTWQKAVCTLLNAGLPKSAIRSYIIVGFAGSPEDDWRRCEVVEDAGIEPDPMWFHRLDCLKHNEVTQEQADRGWTETGRKAILSWYWQHTKKYGIPEFLEKKLKDRKHHNKEEHHGQGDDGED